MFFLTAVKSALGIVKYLTYLNYLTLLAQVLATWQSRLDKIATIKWPPLENGKWKIGGWGRTKKGKKDLAASAFGVEVNKEQGSYPTVLRTTYLTYFTLLYPQPTEVDIFNDSVLHIFYIPFSNILRLH